MRNFKFLGTKVSKLIFFGQALLDSFEEANLFVLFYLFVTFLGHESFKYFQFRHARSISVNPIGSLIASVV